MKREYAILSSFLFAEYNKCGKDGIKPFTLNVDLFPTKLSKRVAEKINETTKSNGSYDLLCLELDDKAAGTHFEREMIEILAAHPLPLELAKKLHDELEKEHLCALI